MVKITHKPHGWAVVELDSGPENVRIKGRGRSRWSDHRSRRSSDRGTVIVKILDHEGDEAMIRIDPDEADAIAALLRVAAEKVRRVLAEQSDE